MKPKSVNNKRIQDGDMSYQGDWVVVDIEKKPATIRRSNVVMKLV